MNASTSVWLIVLLAVVGANLPFVNERWLAVWPHAGRKAWWQRLFELVLLYLLVGGVGLALEQHEGQIYPQGWAFYATTGALFLTLAFPGFVWRYLMRRR
ncbi:DUF2818 family protein [Hydrogenophaga sp. OTU3427]|uniref:DUF2818 family protein n=1 Tax=Hydrogenophaga sp. OTU3427 TaxID=3043856 RepID=UPI00313B450B